MGNGFPIGAISIAPHLKPKHGLLGTTFGGNHLACAAAIAVLDVIKQENLLEHTDLLGKYIIDEARKIQGVREVRGKGLMIGIELEIPCADIRNTLLSEYKMFTGSSSDKNTIRILPALNLKKTDADAFLDALKAVLEKSLKNA